MALTRRQREIYDFIRKFVGDNGYSPSLEEIGAAFGLSSVATVHKHVQHLVEKRYLRKAWNRSPAKSCAWSGTVRFRRIIPSSVPISTATDTVTPRGWTGTQKPATFSSPSMVPGWTTR